MIILQGFTIDEFLDKIESVVENKLEKILMVQKRKKSLRNKYLTREEVCKLLRITLPTLHDWGKAGFIKVYKIGNRVLYKESEIDESIVQVKYGRL